MTLEVSIEPTVLADLEELSANMRTIDAEECRLMHNAPPILALKHSFAASYEVLTGRVNGDLVAVFGIAKLSALNPEGVPWLLGTDLVDKYAFTFARRNKALIDKWSKTHPIMRNYVHVDNSVSIRWLKWLGFEIKEPINYGNTGALFHPFELRSPYHV